MLIRLWRHLTCRELTRALNRMFWKVGPPGSFTIDDKVDDIAGYWVAELSDANVRVRWDPERSCFDV